MMRKQECEFCKQVFLTTPDNTVCKSCDKKLELEQQLEIDKKVLVWNSKRKCTDCGGKLQLDRARVCHACNPDNKAIDDGVSFDEDFIFCA